MTSKVSFDLNEVPKDTNLTDIDENEVFFEEDEQTMQEVFDKPFVGQYFLSEEEAFAFFSNFAKKSGFSIRYGRFENKNGEKRRRDFFCHRQGKPNTKLVDYSKVQRNRTSSKCGCKVYMRITLKRENEIFPEEWQVTILNLEHNHEMLSIDEVRFLPSYRTITTEDESRILLLKEGGLSIRQIMRVMELEKNVSRGQLSFLTKDVRNFFTKIHEKYAHNDAKDLLKYCMKSKSENSNFQYAYTIDDENKLEHIFWSSSQCFDWYQKYGDVVAFDTTYKVNSYDMPFGIFVGIDNYGRTILFGCALLRNETTKTFKWLMEKFVLLMTKAPKTMLTDQDPWMTEAIAQEMPSTKHAFCIWHITAKFSGWFISILRGDYSKWCTEFYNLYKLDTIEEFEQQWPLVIAKYELGENKHINGLYRIKNFWVPAYLREFFFGGMTTTGRSESINSFIKKFISSNTRLTQFIRQVDIAIEDIQQRQIHDIMLEKYKGSSLMSQSPLEEQGRHFLTQFAFKKFQEEFGRAIQYTVKEKTSTTFFVKHHKEIEYNKHAVIWDGKVAKCSCKNFEFVGILCRHILSVFLHKDCFDIPLTYWISRWSRKEVSLSQEAFFINSTSTNDDEIPMEVINLVECPPKSKPKGRPKQRMKGGIELAKKTRLCSLCKSVGHNISTCPEKDKFVGKSDDFSRHAAKKKRVMLENQDLNPIFSLKY